MQIYFFTVLYVRNPAETYGNQKNGTSRVLHIVLTKMTSFYGNRNTADVNNVKDLEVRRVWGGTILIP